MAKEKKEKKEKKEEELKEKKEKKSSQAENADKDERKSKKRKNEDSQDQVKEKKSKKSKVEDNVEKEKVIVVEDQHIDDYRPSAVKEEDNIPESLRLEALPLSASTLKSLKERNVKQFFPIQAAAFDHVMKGKDLLARARTGTGKTLAFSLPMVESLKKQKAENPKEFSKRGRYPRVLIMAPTRELAIQVQKEMDQICSGELVSTCVYGGTGYDNQYYAMKDGLDLIVGTPGRLIDHIERGNLKLKDLRFVCLDEADQMLDIGFAEDMDKILNLINTQKAEEPNAPNHQVLLFSATMPDWIKQAVEKYMKKDKVTLDLIGTNKQKTSATVTHYSLPSRYQNRTDILGDIVAVYGRGNSGRTIIFVETKAEASELAMNEKLVAMGAQALHGDIAQKQRETTMQGFREGKFTCLITTNVCARGVDIPEVDLVINCEPPTDVESYIHRSGRTGRAGKSGICITFYKQAQEYLIQNITKRAGVDFIKIGAPQPADIVSARASQNIEELKLVDPAVFPYFTQAATELLKAFDGDAIKALECAMAMICNTTKPLPSRSLLTANNGYITLLFKTENSIRNVGYIKSIIQKSYPGLAYEDTIAWRMLADYCGVVVDVNEEKVKVEDGSIYLGGKIWKDGKGVSLEIPKELPELQANYGTQQSSYSNNSYGGRGGYSSSRGSRGTGRGASRGASRGRGSARGRGRGGY
ncbi:Nucleolar RNA helicase 2 [Boothiomyces macroporosus]|uniref:RNA helicase n=1 Tax=Boothiomyces macroporosus TaxID=261099 RepID=A0AAD5UP17_9FUNG|nr:Nucleolar RNA helicase 2 [Boothiomyces macroporosus]